MTKKVDAWMPLLIDKYLGDTMGLTTEQHGAYLLLLMAMWKGDGTLPSDDQTLTSITRLAPARWRASKPALMRFFKPTEDGGALTQKRLSEELHRSKSATNAKAAAGAKGAAKKWRKDARKDGAASGDANGTSMAVPSGSQWQTGASIDTPEATLLSPPSDDGGGAKPAASPPAQPPAKPAQVDLLGDLPDCPHEAIIAAFHEALPSARHVRDWTPARAQVLRARWREDRKRQNLDWWRRFFAYCGESAFLTGRASGVGRRPFELSLDWLVKSENFVKVREGAYHEARTEPQQGQAA